MVASLHISWGSMLCITMAKGNNPFAILLPGDILGRTFDLEVWGSSVENS